MFSPHRVNPNVEVEVLMKRHSKARRIKPFTEATGIKTRGRGPRVPKLTRYGYKSGDREYRFADDGSVRRVDVGAGVRGKAAKKRMKRHRGAQA